MESFPVEIPASTPVMISKAAPIVPYDNKGIVAGGGGIQLIVPNGTMQCTGKGGPFLFKPTSHEELASEARKNKIAVYLAAKELKDEGKPEYRPLDPEGPAKFDLHLMSIGNATELPNLSQRSEGQLPLLVQKGTAIYIYGAKTLGG